MARNARTRSTLFSLDTCSQRKTPDPLITGRLILTFPNIMIVRDADLARGSFRRITADHVVGSRISTDGRILTDLVAHTTPKGPTFSPQGMTSKERRGKSQFGPGGFILLHAIAGNPTERIELLVKLQLELGSLVTGPFAACPFQGATRDPNILTRQGDAAMEMQARLFVQLDNEPEIRHPFWQGSFQLPSNAFSKMSARTTWIRARCPNDGRRQIQGEGIKNLIGMSSTTRKHFIEGSSLGQVGRVFPGNRDVIFIFHHCGFFWQFFMDAFMGT